ncbi:T9SS type A sorting domain-containing protein [Chryseobacterium soli]|nr:T9SS type A sorting domain-containing protein [Chryseobacterium soli]
MKKIFLLLYLMLICPNQLSAQFGGGNPLTYDITFIRDDDYNSADQPYVSANLTLSVKIGTTEISKTYLPIHTPSNPGSTPQNYTFPVTVGTQPIRYAKVTFTQPSNLYSGYYPLPTTIGDHVMLSDPCLIDYDWQYGYGVGITCTGVNKYRITPTKFTCNLCIRPVQGCGSIAKNTTLQQQVSLAPNPTMGFSELHYTATEKETVSISVSDFNGKIITAYTIDLREGLNKLPIDLQSSLGGTYIVHWKSSNGSSGSLKMIKN